MTTLSIMLYSGDMKTFISYRHTGEKTEDLEPLLTSVCESLASSGVDTYCTFFNQDDFTSQSLGPHEIMQKAFEIIDDSDFLLVIQASERKSEGMLMEVGYCIAKKIPVIVAVKEGVDDTYLPDMANYAITWRSPDDLASELTAANFAEIIA
jgi:nucleoside 2-deoxyribosyltransferase